jgi:flagellar hook-associated protein 1
MTKQISALNEKIAQAPGALDLQDQRDLLVEQLNQIVGVNTVQDSSGRYNIFLGGAVLVSSSGSYDMSVSVDTANNMQFSISTTGGASNINSQISNGQLKANLDMRDTVITGYMNSLNTFAIDLADKVNYISRQGYGLDGSTGNIFFNSLVNITNPTVGTMSSVSVNDVSAYGASINNQYQVDYIDSTTYSGLTAAQQAAYQQEGTSGIYWRVQQSSDNGGTWTDVPTSSVTVTPDGTGAYRTLLFNGLTMRIDGTQANLTTAVSGTFDVQLDRNAAADLKSSITDFRKIAAAQSAASLPGDSTNAQAIADLVDQNFVANTNPVKFYADIVSNSGADSQSSQTYVKFETSMVNQLESQRQSTSGVNLDEEAVNLVQYEKTYEAASKMITVGSDLLDTLISMIK